MEHISHIADLLNSNSAPLKIKKKELEASLDVLFHKILFPVCDEGCKSGKSIYMVYSTLLDNLMNLVKKEEAIRIADQFIEKLPQLQKQLYREAENYLNNDPASESVEEVIIAYPGFFAIAVHRIAHELYQLSTPLIPRLFSEYAHACVGIDIHPGATIGDLFYIDHGTGIVIGETTVIGDNVKLYQGVTLGAKFVDRQLKGVKRHPTIENNVVIYAGATILGGDTSIGHDSTIGGNVWLTESVPPFSIVYHEAKIKIDRDKKKNIIKQ